MTLVNIKMNEKVVVVFLENRCGRRDLTLVHTLGELFISKLMSNSH
jgi:hypothetical protein